MRREKVLQLLRAEANPQSEMLSNPTSQQIATPRFGEKLRRRQEAHGNVAQTSVCDLFFLAELISKGTQTEVCATVGGLLHHKAAAVRSVIIRRDSVSRAAFVSRLPGS
jgi:hypothetical protein